MRTIMILMIIASLIDFHVASCQDNKAKPTFELQTFSDFPKDIDGCSCYFSKNDKDFKNQLYFFVNDFASLAYVKVKSQFVKLDLVNSSKDKTSKSFYEYKSKDFKLRIDIVSSKPSGGEASKLTGKLTITFKNGEKLVLDFVGECGC